MKVRSAEQLMQESLMVKHLAGSHAYGTALPSSDVDYRGVFCADPIHIRTPFFHVNECSDTTEEDTKYYELAHFMKLCIDCNPNIVETLWVADEDIRFRTPAYDVLRASRSELLSAKAAFTFSGYALAQLKRIKGHNKWITNPQPAHAPQPYQFLSVVQWFGHWWWSTKNLHVNVGAYLDDHRLIPYGRELYGVYKASGYRLWDISGNLNTQYEGSRHELGRPVFIVKFNRDEYKVAKEKYEQYWEWKRNRNTARSELEEEFGYDTKHAMHLVRLLRMGEEILTTGEVRVKRPDAKELLEVRNGEWEYNDLVDWATRKDRFIRDTCYNTTTLPKRPDIKFAANLLMDLQDIMWNGLPTTSDTAKQAE